MKIPFHVPGYGPQDEAAILRVVRSGVLVGDGPATTAAVNLLVAELGVPHVLLTTSCTHALELAMMAAPIGPGDEVIVPSFTFVSSTNCILRQGAKVVFAEVRPDTLTLDPDDVRRKISPSTRAIMPVVYAGVTPDLDAILSIAHPRNILVIEDAAQGIAARYHGKPAGTIGDVGCYSFHETKNFSTGEGGAFVTSRDDIARRAEIIREKGTNRKQFLMGLVDKYTWVDVGSSFLPPDTMPALLVSQLSNRQAVQSRRRLIYERYMRELAPAAGKGDLTLPVIPDGVESNHHIFHILLRDETTRNHALSFFRERGIGTTFHYLPLHLSHVGRSLGYAPGDFPVTESASARLLRLPIYPSLSDEQQAQVIGTLQEFLA